MTGWEVYALGVATFLLFAFVFAVLVPRYVIG